MSKLLKKLWDVTTDVQALAWVHAKALAKQVVNQPATTNAIMHVKLHVKEHAKAVVIQPVTIPAASKINNESVVTVIRIL